ncbi:MAG: 4-hydroxybenzoate octaprenyltransferase [Gammaproteobacteria bacterium]|nr:4-hydroxybenzoate octaprenyltransferase [Gammaproteobacteria bacterium]
MHQKVQLSRLSLYLQLMRFDRPIGTLLLLWPTLWGLWIAAEGFPDPLLLVIFSLGVFLMRSAGCVINDYADRHIDVHVERTSERPLASGKVSEKEALGLFFVLIAIAFFLVLFLNRFTILLSAVGVFLAASYPFMKRFTHLPQAYLGMAFGWAIPMAFAAQTGELDPRLWWIFLATVLWAISYDTMYAMVDREDDLKIGVKSTAILFGKHDRLIIGIIQVAMLAVLVKVGVLFTMGILYFAGITAAAGLSVYHQYLIRERDRGQCFKAFLNNNWLGVAVFAGIVADYMIRA